MQRPGKKKKNAQVKIGNCADEGRTLNYEGGGGGTQFRRSSFLNNRKKSLKVEGARAGPFFETTYIKGVPSSPSSLFFFFGCWHFLYYTFYSTLPRPALLSVHG